MKPISIGIAGIGNVGEEVLKQLLASKEINKKFFVHGLSYKSKNKLRSINLNSFKYYKNATHLALDSNIDLIIELIGGSDGIAKELCFESINNGKAFITANKALIANHGAKISSLALKKKVFIGFEAAVAGSLPIIKVIKESLIANNILQITGILNGTSNYLLDEIEKTSLTFEKVLKTAQKLGYAESDPTFDIDGIDAAHKILILSALAFKKIPELKNLYVKGISDISLNDIKFANRYGYKIKLLGIACNKDQFQCSVEPWLIPESHSLANVRGVLNAIEINSDLSGPILLSGPGAGSKATSSSVLSDVYDYLAKSNRIGLSNTNSKLRNVIKINPFKDNLKFYLRITVIDKYGVLADLTNIFKQSKISIKSFFQEIEQCNNYANLIIITYETNRNIMSKVIEKISFLKGVVKKPVHLSIYD